MHVVMKYFAGTLFIDGKFAEGYLGVEEGIIKRIGKGNCPQNPAGKGTILPAFVNAHTHIGDSAVRLDPKKKYTFEELVAPPNGYKHRTLAGMRKAELVDGIRESHRTMLESGTSHFMDFREGGIRGVKLLKDAISRNPPGCTILGRPAGMNYDLEEVSWILKDTDGLGLSAVSDWEYPELEKLSSHARREGKIFAMHASERVREDIDKVLGLKPRFVVHMLEATESDLERCADANTPVVICPRSNHFFGRRPKISRMLKAGCTLMLGTDNCMISTPNVWQELGFMRSAGLIDGKAALCQILKIATVNSGKILNNVSGLGLAEGAPARFQVLDGKLDYISWEAGGASGISHVQIGRKYWRRSR
jgi:cytosine/adenosine deaminase-related metal-dependent hydrolase